MPSTKPIRPARRPRFPEGIPPRPTRPPPRFTPCDEQIQPRTSDLLCLLESRDRLDRVELCLLESWDRLDRVEKHVMLQKQKIHRELVRKWPICLKKMDAKENMINALRSSGDELGERDGESKGAGLALAREKISDYLTNETINCRACSNLNYPNTAQVALLGHGDESSEERRLRCGAGWGRTVLPVLLGIIILIRISLAKSPWRCRISLAKSLWRWNGQTKLKQC